MMNTDAPVTKCSTSAAPVAGDAEVVQLPAVASETTKVVQHTNQPSTSAETPVKPLSNVQIIKLQKQEMFNWAKTKKLFKLAMFSKCQAEGCECPGWKTSAEIIKGRNTDFTQPLESFQEACKLCSHWISKDCFILYLYLYILPTAPINIYFEFYS